MDRRRFEGLKARVEQDLTVAQCLELAEVLRGVAERRAAEFAVEDRGRHLRERRTCPRCGHADVVAHGRDATGRQRFRCRRGEAGGCGRTFNALTGTPLARMRKPEEWLGFAAAMAEHRSLDAVRASGVGVSRHTAWRWRHRLLAPLAAQPEAPLRGVIEADETFFRDSFKGSRGWKRGAPPAERMPRYRGGPAARPGISAEQVPVLTALDRSGGVVERVLEHRGQIAAALEGRIARGSVVCSDGLKAYVEAAVRAGSEHRRIDPPRQDWAKKAMGGKPRRPGRLGLGHVNAHHERMKTFANREARGVSTRYLPHYLAWQTTVRKPGFSAESLITARLIHT